MLKAILSLTYSLMIRFAMFTTIQSSLTSFAYNPGFLYCGQGPVEVVRSYKFLLITINLVMLDYISQLVNPISFSRLASTPPLFNSSAMTRVWWLFFGVSEVSRVGEIF